MKRASAGSRQPGRPAIAARLRALAVLLAVLLGTSSLAQVAHFLLVPHAICAAHGELIELHDGEPVAHADDADDADEAHRTRASAPSDAESEHDHCELMARAEREQLLPPAPVAAVAAAPSAAGVVPAAAHARVAGGLGLLELAPKTSPPSARG